MAVIVVAGAEPGDGATTVAVGLAHRLAYAGRTVRLERLAGDERAAADATVFAAQEFAAGSGAPLDPPALAASPGDAVTVVEAPAGATDAAAIAAAMGGSLLLVSADGGAAASGAAASGAAASGATAGGATGIANHANRAAPLAIPEDGLLAAPTVGRLIEVSGARVLARSLEGDGGICEQIVIGPISEDAGQPHFERFPRKAVVTRAEKVDVALAALQTETRCLILTGGVDPSPYLLDRVAADRSTTLLLAPGSTVETVRDLQGAFGSSPFSGHEKVDRIGDLMAAAVDDAALAVLLGGA